MKDPHSVKYKTLMNRGQVCRKGKQSSIFRRMNEMKMSLLYKAIYRFRVMVFKFPMTKGNTVTWRGTGEGRKRLPEGEEVLGVEESIQQQDCVDLLSNPTCNRCDLLHRHYTLIKLW